ncbi:hypothetical protein OEZ86_012659 [Tetradesmus obliquus]|nr:hypothetical protein OEZ86_012659 [Tetradesmus obliquus]
MSGENKQSNKVFIGGLSWETSDAKLRSYFENFGSVLEAFVSYDRNTGRPRGFGFVVFESSEVADKVVASKHTIDRREVEAKKAVPKEDNPTPSQPADAAQKTRKIFVGGLAPSVDEQVLRQYFEQFGQVDDAVVMYDHDNKRPRGFGFITFAEEDSVDNVFSHGAMQNIHDKQIEIKPAVPRDQMPPAARRAPPFFPGRGAGMPVAAAFPPGRAPPYGFRQPGLPAAAYARGYGQGAGPSPRASIVGGYGSNSPQDRGPYSGGLPVQYSQQMPGGNRYSPAPGGAAAGGRFPGMQQQFGMYGGLGFGAEQAGLVQPGSSPVGGMYNLNSLQQQLQQQQQQLGQQGQLNGYPGQLDMSMGGKLGLAAAAAAAGRPDLQPGAAAAAAAAAAAMAKAGYGGGLGAGVGGFPNFSQPGPQQFAHQPDTAGYQSADQVAAAAGYGADPVAHLPGTSPLGTPPEFASFGAGSAAGWSAS